MDGQRRWRRSLRHAPAPRPQRSSLVTGVVTRGGKAVSGGRVGGWRKRLKEMNRMGAMSLRGRTLAMWGYE